MPDGTLPTQPTHAAQSPGAAPAADETLVAHARDRLSAPPRSRNLVRIALGATAALALLVGISLGSAVKSSFTTRTVIVPASQVITGQADAIDGATLRLGALELRLQGIDAPPVGFVCRDGAWQAACGAQARRALEQELRDRNVECVIVAVQGDGRATATCVTEQGVDLAAAQVQAGWAVVSMKQRDAHYLPEQSSARDENRGLWRDDFAKPDLWRRPAA